jgi:succinate dehydrogenase/fumarate reductase cytochrome b subunit
MWVKVVIVLLFIANLVALGTAFYTLMLDQGRGSNRTANLLLVRVSLAGLLLLFVIYGVWSGDLGITAPWHGA